MLGGKKQIKYLVSRNKQIECPSQLSGKDYLAYWCTVEIKL